MPKVFLRDRAVELLEEELAALGVEGVDLSDVVVQLVIEVRKARLVPAARKGSSVRGSYS